MLNRFTEDQREYGQPKSDSENRPIAQAAGNPKHGADPDGRGGGKAGHVTIGIPQNHARAQKTDPRENTLQDSADRIWIHRSRLARKSERDDSSHGGSEGDQGVGAQASRFAVQFAV